MFAFGFVVALAAVYLVFAAGYAVQVRTTVPHPSARVCILAGLRWPARIRFDSAPFQ